jgi:hypothetical protein
MHVDLYRRANSVDPVEPIDALRSTVADDREFDVSRLKFLEERCRLGGLTSGE